MNKVIFQLYPHFIDRMQEFYKENNKINKCDIALLGDSLVEMFKVEYLDMPNYSIINRGIVSDKSQGVLISLDDRIKPINPKVVFLLIGSNDICDGYLALDILNNYTDIITTLKEFNPNIKIICSTILPPCYHSALHVERIYPDCRNIDKIKYINAKIKAISHEYKADCFDAYAILADIDDSLEVNDTLDGIHITKEAYLKLVALLRPLLINRLEGE